MESYDNVIDTLKTQRENILGNRWKEAEKGVLKTVENWIKNLGLPEEVFTRYLEFIDDENILYYSKAYRDHFFHVFHNFLLGFQILYEFRDEEDTPFGKDYWNENRFLKKWLLTCLWHDLTYILEKGGSKGLKEFIDRKLQFDIEIKEYWSRILTKKENINAIDILSERFDSKDPIRKLKFREWLQYQIVEKHDHGIVSAILLLKDGEKWTLNKDIIKDSDLALYQDIIEESSLAIALHNYHKSNKFDGELIIEEYPLAFLLSYCDTAQEWGRPSAFNVPNLFEYYKTKVNMAEKCIKIYLKVNLNKIDIENEKLSGKTQRRYNDAKLRVDNRLKNDLSALRPIFEKMINEVSTFSNKKTEDQLWQIINFYNERDKIENAWKSDHWVFNVIVRPYIE